MKVASGPRPWTIWVFCAVSLALAGYRTVLYFANLTDVQPMFEDLAPWFDWNRDWVIVATSAWLTIDLIPVVLVWFYASRFARGFILGMTMLIIAMALYEGVLRSPDALSLLIGAAGMMVPLALASLLFLPQSQSWFTHEERDETAVFQ